MEHHQNTKEVSISETKTCRLQIPALRPLKEEGHCRVLDPSIFGSTMSPSDFSRVEYLGFFFSLYLDHTAVFFECKGLAAYWNEGVKEERTMDNEELVLSVLRERNIFHVCICALWARQGRFLTESSTSISFGDPPSHMLAVEEHQFAVPNPAYHISCMWSCHLKGYLKHPRGMLVMPCC